MKNLQSDIATQDKNLPYCLINHNINFDYLARIVLSMLAIDHGSIARIVLYSIELSFLTADSIMASTRAQHSFSPVARTRKDPIRKSIQSMKAATVTGSHSSKDLLRGYISWPWLIINLKLAHGTAAKVPSPVQPVLAYRRFGRLLPTLDRSLGSAVRLVRRMR